MPQGPAKRAKVEGAEGASGTSARPAPAPAVGCTRTGSLADTFIAAISDVAYLGASSARGGDFDSMDEDDVPLVSLPRARPPEGGTSATCPPGGLGSKEGGSVPAVGEAAAVLVVAALVGDGVADDDDDDTMLVALAGTKPADPAKEPEDAKIEEEDDMPIAELVRAEPEVREASTPASSSSSTLPPTSELLGSLSAGSSSTSAAAPSPSNSSCSDSESESSESSSSASSSASSFSPSSSSGAAKGESEDEADDGRVLVGKEEEVADAAGS